MYKSTFQVWKVFHRNKELIYMKSSNAILYHRVVNQWKKYFQRSIFTSYQQIATNISTQNSFVMNIFNALTQSFGINEIIMYDKLRIIIRQYHINISEVPVVYWRCLWCNGYRCRNWTRRYVFKSSTRLIAFHIALIPLGKVWI